MDTPNITTPVSPETCTSSSSTSSAPHYSEDVRRPLNNLNLLTHYGSNSSSKFFCEIDLGDEERDTFSPVNSNHPSPSSSAANILSNLENIHDSNCSISASTSHTVTDVLLTDHITINTDNNLHYENTLPALKSKLTNTSNTSGMHATASSKEEKQRQNEEIVILETSSISSETESWESILPQNASSSAVADVINSMNSIQPINIRDPMDFNSFHVDFLHPRDGKLNVNNTIVNKPASSTTTTNAAATDSISNTTKNFNNVNCTVGQNIADVLSIDLLPTTSNSRIQRESENLDIVNIRATASLVQDTIEKASSCTNRHVLQDHEPNNSNYLKHDVFIVANNNGDCGNVINKPQTSNCFIDASSLCDENEVVSFTNLNDIHENCNKIQKSAEYLAQSGPAAAAATMYLCNNSNNNINENAEFINNNSNNINENDSPTRRLETFHKSFARCKIKSFSQKESSKDDDTDNRPQSSSSCSSHEQENIPTTHSGLETASNLSDEEKLWKRDHHIHSSSQGSRATTDEKKALEQNKHELPNTAIASDEVTEASISLAQDVDSSDSSDVIKCRQGSGGNDKQIRNDDQSRQHFNHLSTNLDSQQQQQQELQQPLAPLTLPITATANKVSHSGMPLTLLQNAQLIGHCDLSYTTDYSSSSPAPSLVWSEHDQQRSTTHNHVRLMANIDDFDQSQIRAVSSNTINNSNNNGISNTLPDTPHNSMVQIEASSSNSSSTHRDYTLSSPFSQYRDSGAYCSDATDSPILMPRTPKKTNYNECNPILTGGPSINNDLETKQWRESPVLIRDTTEICSLPSDGFTDNNNSKNNYRNYHYQRQDEPIKNFNDNNGETVQKNQELEDNQYQTKKPMTGVSSWIVDMSDCQRSNERRKSNSLTMEQTSQVRYRERSDSNSSHKSGCGFYIPLTEPCKKTSDDLNRINNGNNTRALPGSLSKSYNAPSSVQHYATLSTSEYIPKNLSTSNTVQSNLAENIDNEISTDHNLSKNIFSMFIDISNGEKKGRRNNHRREPFNLAQKLSFSLKNNHHTKTEGTESVLKSSASSTETLTSKNLQNNLHNMQDASEDDRTESKSLDYKANLEIAESSKPIMRNGLPKSKCSNDSNKRHSWSNNMQSNKSNNTPPINTDCKRSISLTNNNENYAMTRNDGNSEKGLMSIIDKLPILSKTMGQSSLSVDSSVSPYDDYKSSKSELSGASSGAERCEDNGNERDNYHIRMKKRRRDVQLNETFDKSSAPSITDGILSKDISPLSNTTETDDVTFQQDDDRATINFSDRSQQLDSQAEIGTASTSNIPLQTATTNRMTNLVMETIIETKETNSPKKNLLEGISMESLHATIEKQKMLLETVNELGESEKHANYVKLSDMDKPLKLLRTEYKSNPDSMSTSVGNHRQINRLYRDENRTRPHSWSMSRSTGNSFQNITNSVENMRSLSRLFPNLSKEISNSLPNDMSLDNMDYMQTDLSTESSLASSISRSGMDESSISCRQPRRLGEDLLKMFLQEIATDMMVEVHGRRIKAHKCILRSRCQYFAAMLAGNHTTSVVSLQGYSYFAVHFALCHIYSGASHPPDGISLMELAALADLLGLEGLKEVTSHALKTNYCHNFHKPCSGCMDGILQVLPVALNHALDDLYRKCLKWTCRHYLKVWPTRQFAQLPQDILGRCRQQIVALLTSESVLDTILDCDHILTQLMNCRWGDVCEALINDILDAAYRYMGDHFASLIASDSFLLLGHDRSCHIPRLEGILLRISSNLNADQACRSYQHITRLNIVLQAKVIQMPPGLDDLVKELQGLQNEDLEWDAEYIRLVSALLSAIEQCLIRQCSRAMRVASWQRMDLELRKKIQTLARLTEPLDLKRNKFVGKAFSFGGNSRSQDLHQFKLAIQAHTKKSLAQDNQLYKATQTHAPVQTIERGVQANHDLKEYVGRVSKSNSRTQVQQSIGIDRNVATHRRTKSEAPIDSTINSNKVIDAKKSNSEKIIVEINTATATKPRGQQLKFSDVRSRYLEPKKVHNENTAPMRSVTSSNIPSNMLRGNKTGRTHSSSGGSSRRSSPALSGTTANRSKKATENKSTTNMSLDSLTSVRGRSTMSHGKAGKLSDNERHSDICVDSINDSLRSSIITNQTTSRDSLNSTQQVKMRSNSNKSDRKKHSLSTVSACTNNDNSNKSSTSGGRIKDISSNTSTAKSSRPTSLGAKTPRYLQQKVISAGSSPSSVATTKSATSRLSSVSSTQSPKGVYKRSMSSTVTGQYDNAVAPRKSFLSAKSREILAKKAEKDKLQQEQLQQQQQQHEQKHLEKSSCAKRINLSDHEIKSLTGPIVVRSASHSSVIAANQSRGIYPSNIPTRRPNTLHLKKTYNSTSTARTAASMDMINKNLYRKQQASYNVCENNGLQFYPQNNNSDEVFQTAHALNDKMKLLLETNSISYNENNDDCNQMDLASIVPASEPVIFESKLERSSTFCKESADIVDINDQLQIIE